jgi:hypothetical protein
MSALARFADSSRTFPDDREVPIAAVSRCSNMRDSNHLVGSREQRGRGRSIRRRGESVRARTGESAS